MPKLNKCANMDSMAYFLRGWQIDIFDKRLTELTGVSQAKMPCLW